MYIYICIITNLYKICIYIYEAAGFFHSQMMSPTLRYRLPDAALPSCAGGVGSDASGHCLRSDDGRVKIGEDVTIKIPRLGKSMENP